MPAAGPLTITIAKADVGGWAGDATTHPDLLEAVVPPLDQRAETGGLLKDFIVTHAGDDIALILAHTRGAAHAEVRAAATEAFGAAAHRAKELKLHGLGEPAITFAELTFRERPSEPIVVFLTDKTGPGAFNLPLYRAFADPFTTWSLVGDRELARGFTFDVLDLETGKRAAFSCPEDAHSLLATLGHGDRFALTRISRRDGEPTAAISVGDAAHSDPVALIRTGPGFLSLGEVLEPWARPLLVPGPPPRRTPAPILPVGLDDSVSTRAEGPPRAVALGFTVASGELVGPLDLFADAAFERARRDALHMADFLRRQGPFTIRGDAEAGALHDPARWT